MLSLKAGKCCVTTLTNNKNVFKETSKMRAMPLKLSRSQSDRSLAGQANGFFLSIRIRFCHSHGT